MGNSDARELKRLVSLERAGISPAPCGYSVALVFPNLYRIGMSNLGFQLVYALLNSTPGVRCERAFLMQGTESRSVEGLRFLGEFNCVGFSLSCERDYPNVLEIMRRARLPLLSRERDERFPLIVGGGVCATLNPEPLAEVFDIFVVGEAEAVAGDLFQRMIREDGRSREELLRAVAEIPGIYVPRLCEPRHGADGRISSVEMECPAPQRVWVRDLDAFPCGAPIVTPETEFGERTMVELMRGCGRRCRFCVTDYAYRPLRVRSASVVEEAVTIALERSRGVALLGPSLTDYPWLERVCETVVERGGDLSISSLRVSGVTEGLLKVLARGGLKSLTVAPETPSDFLQRRINKEISAADVEAAARRAAEAGFREMKMYYLVGIPGETESDLRAIAEEARAVASLIPVRLSLGPLIPKARTPLQWAAMAPLGELRSKYKLIRKLFGKIPRARLNLQSLREAVFEATLARADRRITPHLIAGRLPRESGYEYAMRERDGDEIFPWEHISSGVGRDYLWEEYQRFLEGKLT